MPFELRSNLDLNCHEDSFVKAHLRRCLFGCLRDFQITLEESAGIALTSVKIPTEKYSILGFFPAIEIVLEFQKILSCFVLFYFTSFNFIYLYVVLISTISLPITVRTS